MDLPYPKHLKYMCNGLECGVPVQLTAMVEQKAFGGYRLVGDRAKYSG
jgi:hypothetical protein